MNFFKVTFLSIFMILCFSSIAVKAHVNWDFENGNDHGFSLWSVNPATPAADDPLIAGDEKVTGIGGPKGLPEAGCCWSIGPPNQYDMKAPAVEEGCHVDQGVLQYSDCNDPFGVFSVDPPSYVNGRGQSSYLNTYNLNMWGDSLHTPENDQIATSPAVLLSEGAMLVVWLHGGGSWYYRYNYEEGAGAIAPEPETDRKKGYKNRSIGIAVLSAQDSSFLASIKAQPLMILGEFELDLSEYAGQTVIIEVVDAIDWSWGWIAIDEIQITNATLAPVDITSKPSAKPMTYALMQNYPNPFNPTTTIRFAIPEAGNVNLSIYNTTGALIETLIDEHKIAGTHQIKYDGSHLASGVYFYRVQTGSFNQIRKMILIK